MSSPGVAPAAWLAVYCLAAFLAALGGGLLPSLVRLTHTRMQVAITTLMAAGNATRASRWLVNLGFALVTPLGALLFFVGAGQMVIHHPAWLGTALAFCAGTFLYVAGADLLPELQFHRDDRVPLTLALLAGIGVAVVIVQFGHGDDPPGHLAQRTGSSSSIVGVFDGPSLAGSSAPAIHARAPILLLARRRHAAPAIGATRRCPRDHVT